MQQDVFVGPRGTPLYRPRRYYSDKLTLPGDVHRQGFAPGAAEDMAEVAATHRAGETAPAAQCSAGCLVTREFLPIDSDVEEFKHYAPGIGNILVVDDATGDREELVEVIFP